MLLCSFGIVKVAIIISNIFQRNFKLRLNNYFVESSFLNNCGDKGLSVGENSVANFQNIEVLNSNTGVASKDFSNTNIERIIMENVNNCLQLYNKKQEFSGASLFVKDFNCKNFTNESSVESTSILIIEKR